MALGIILVGGYGPLSRSRSPQVGNPVLVASRWLMVGGQSNSCANWWVGMIARLWPPGVPEHCPLALSTSELMAAA